MTLPIVRVTRPGDLKGVENGKVPAKLLVDVGDGGKLHHVCARSWLALVAMCTANGLPLTWTKGGMYRSLAAQVTLFKSRYAVGASGGGCRQWDSDGDGKSETWCRKDAHVATAAVPGTSNHGWGLAIDVAYDFDVSDGISTDDAAFIKQHPQFEWFVDILEEFGFSFEIQSEPWHIRYFAGDDIPQATLDFEESGAPSPTPGAKYMQWAPPISRGSFGPNVLMCQSILQARGHDLTCDGQFGKQTEDNVKWFQNEYGLTVDGKVGPQTWNALGATEPKVDVP